MFGSSIHRNFFHQIKSYQIKSCQMCRTAPHRCVPLVLCTLGLHPPSAQPISAPHSDPFLPPTPPYLSRRHIPSLTPFMQHPIIQCLVHVPTSCAVAFNLPMERPFSAPLLSFRAQPVRAWFERVLIHYPTRSQRPSGPSVLFNICITQHTCYNEHSHVAPVSPTINIGGTKSKRRGRHAFRCHVTEGNNEQCTW